MPAYETSSINIEQLVFCFWWIDTELHVHEDFVGMHTIESKKSDTVLSKMSLHASTSLYLTAMNDVTIGANNMTVYKKKVSTQILEESPLAFLTHCYGHALNLAIGDMIKQERQLRSTVDTTYKLLSHKRVP